jgi:hypothetical protein
MSESLKPRPGWRHRVCAHHPCNPVARALNGWLAVMDRWIDYDPLAPVVVHLNPNSCTLIRSVCYFGPLPQATGSCMAPSGSARLQNVAAAHYQRTASVGEKFVGSRDCFGKSSVIAFPFPGRDR